VKIYTKTGDKGDTGLLGGDRVSKNSPRIHAIGSMDEVNAYVGIALLSDLPALVTQRLGSLQHTLFDLGSELACPPDGKFELISVKAEHIESIEQEIDQMTDELPPLKNFILPGGTIGAAHLHYLRAIVRRLERDLLRLNEEEPLRNEMLIFVNRLSDWLFCSARYVNHKLGVSDVAWKKGS
jgi:cob(I)alamin adenosyltransferase